MQGCCVSVRDMCPDPTMDRNSFGGSGLFRSLRPVLRNHVPGPCFSRGSPSVNKSGKGEKYVSDFSVLSGASDGNLMRT